MKMFIVPLLAVSFLFPIASQAVSFSLPSFGGYVNAVIPCTCSLGLWIYYTPLFLNSGIPVSGALYYPPTAILYAFFSLVPTTWELGGFAPAPNTACLVFAPNPVDPCIPLPAAGIIGYVGTSMPGALPK